LAPERAWWFMDTVYGYAFWGLLSVTLLGLGLAVMVW
jgi:F0F1-type ATP synthase assembly protein I